MQTFLFTDLEGSTRAWERAPEAMEGWLAAHDRAVVEAIRAHGGQVFKHTGDGVCAVFASPLGAVHAAHAVQAGLAAAGPEAIGPLRARVALHAGEARARDGDFYGPALNRCARLLDVGHGGQVLLSAAVGALIDAPALAAAGLVLADLGRHRLRDLQEPQQIWQLAGPGLEPAFPPLRSLDSFAHNLPVQRSSFVGRESELEAVRGLLATHRLVTVAGVGGCGKTRLALAVAAAEVPRFADGVCLVDLSAVAESGLVASAVAGALRVPAGPGSSEERVREFLSDRHTLLVVDNCEHLLDGCAATVDAILAACARVTVLATSREPLGLDGERVWRVPSLGLPDGDSLEAVGRSEATRLFVDRATAVRPGFALSTENAAAVREICRRLDGIPLAIELAAARVAHLAPHEIATRLSDRFRLLTGGRRNVQRQQTLQAVLDWSHDLLSDAERTLLRRLSVFAGGWTLDAAQAVCAGGAIEEGTVIDLLGGLVVRSLVETEDRGDHTRYGFMETVRLYAEERLVAAGEATETRTAHARWFLQATEASPDARDVAFQRLWFARGAVEFVTDLDNVAQAAEWWRTQARYDLMLRITVAAAPAFFSHGRLDEPDEWLAAARTRDAELPVPLRTLLHTALALAAEMRGDFLQANEMARAAIAVTDNPVDAGGAYSILIANLTWMDPDEAERLLDTAPAWTGDLGPRADAYVRSARGSIANARADYEKAVVLLSDPVLQQHTDPRRFELAVAHLMRGDLESAAAVLDDAAVNANPWFWYNLPLWRALIAAQRGDPARARADLGLALAAVRRTKIPLGVADCVVGCAALAFHAGDPGRAAELLAAVQAATGGGLRSPISMCVYRGYRRKVRAALDAGTVARARRAGAALTLEAAVARELGG